MEKLTEWIIYKTVFWRRKSRLSESSICSLSIISLRVSVKKNKKN